MSYWRTQSEFFQYLASNLSAKPDDDQLPAMNALSAELDISVARLREQLEVAKALGFVDVRPRTGIRRLPYSFLPAVWQSLKYAIEVDRANFDAFSSLRKHVEMIFWHQAAGALTPEDHAHLRNLVAEAWSKLRGTPIRIPQEEHREFHLLIFRRLDNPFVLGILEAYWEAYEAVGLNVYADYDYLKEVWNYHQQMVDAICEGDLEAGYQALVEHTDLLYHRPNAGSPEW
ncbi:MAG: FadR family transcriptional regulator [Anaerolineales bacterium]|nr:FadR family transcriptional regulator [Anaerolineales bacterium]